MSEEEPLVLTDDLTVFKENRVSTIFLESIVLLVYTNKYITLHLSP